MNAFLLPLLLIFITITNVQHTYAQTDAPTKPLIQIKKYPAFSMPIDCALGEDCWIMNYVDMGPDDGLKTDPACLERTYDGHKGTDFAILDAKAMERGVDVIAPLDGTVKRVRDGEEDRWPDAQDLENTKAARKECGNAALIDHGNGVETIFCHMKKGSIKPRAGERVKKGDIIGQVGMSGMTEFPHLHFGIMLNGVITDPFTGQPNTGNCGARQRILWEKNLDVEYQQISITANGFSNNIPDLNIIEKDASTPDKISLSSDILTYWVVILGAREGDQILIQIKDPNGKIFAAREILQDKNRARQFYYAGRKTTNVPLIEGAYSGHVTITRTGKKGQPQDFTKATAVLVSR